MKRVQKLENPLIRSYRELLGGVSPQVSEEELKKSFRKLALLYHPDKNPAPESQAQFIRITEAFKILSDASLVERLNKKYVDQKLFHSVIVGLNISFGSFFGYRKFATKRISREFRIGKEKLSETDGDLATFALEGSEESFSILDNPAFDSIELVYAGKFSLGDEERIMGGFKGSQLAQLPWVMINNSGIMQFLDGKFLEALKCYEELNERIPRNIIFMYRLGLCHGILAFRDRKKNILGKLKPDPRHFKKAVTLLRQAIALGENRPIGKQKCLTIRKILADLYEKAGESRLSREVWEEVRFLQPKSIEAKIKTSRLFKLGSR